MLPKRHHSIIGNQEKKNPNYKSLTNLLTILAMLNIIVPDEERH
jgi:hypothetical protein